MRFIVASAHTGKVSHRREQSMVALGMALQERGVAFIPSKDIWPDTFPGNVPFARASLLYRMAEELDEGDWVYKLDSDVSMHPKHVLELLEHDQDIVVRAYPLKPGPNGEWGWSCTPTRDAKGGLVWHEERRLIEIKSSGLGAVMMKASVAKAMREHVGTVGLEPRTVPAYDYIVDPMGKQRYEDASFFWRWCEQMKRKAYCAPDAPVRNGERSGNFYTQYLAKGPS